MSIFNVPLDEEVEKRTAHFNCDIIFPARYDNSKRYYQYRTCNLHILIYPFRLVSQMLRTSCFIVPPTRFRLRFDAASTRVLLING
jgi:hypothetical protein